MNTEKKAIIRNLKKKLWAAFVMMLIGAILVGTASYAWLVLSTAPEVTGIDTSVGANGSLEIALLNTTTYNDLSAIQTRIGNSLDNSSATSANITWGNLVNLSDASYGLGSINLKPSILNMTGTQSLSSNAPIKLPEYGTDGRITRLSETNLSAVYDSGSDGFTYSGFQTYGVRGLGISSSVSQGEIAVTSAKAAMSQYSMLANNAAKHTAHALSVVLHHLQRQPGQRA